MQASRYNENQIEGKKINLYLRPRQEPDIMQKLAALQRQQAGAVQTILYPAWIIF